MITVKCKKERKYVVEHREESKIEKRAYDAFMENGTQERLQALIESAGPQGCPCTIEAALWLLKMRHTMAKQKTGVNLDVRLEVER